MPRRVAAGPFHRPLRRGSGCGPARLPGRRRRRCARGAAPRHGHVAPGAPGHGGQRADGLPGAVDGCGSPGQVTAPARCGSDGSDQRIAARSGNTFRGIAATMPRTPDRGRPSRPRWPTQPYGRTRRTARGPPAAQGRAAGRGRWRSPRTHRGPPPWTPFGFDLRHGIRSSVVGRCACPVRKVAEAPAEPGSQGARAVSGCAGGLAQSVRDLIGMATTHSRTLGRTAVSGPFHTGVIVSGACGRSPAGHSVAGSCCRPSRRVRADGCGPTARLSPSAAIVERLTAGGPAVSRGATACATPRSSGCRRPGGGPATGRGAPRPAGWTRRGGRIRVLARR